MVVVAEDDGLLVCMSLGEKGDGAEAEVRGVGENGEDATRRIAVVKSHAESSMMRGTTSLCR